ncbi:MAG: TetR/AcrR family transcriptional regulator [Deltaproteobacteria bacterium]|nr:TetR/AcrR family transcriptional regulator [Deltaproteobacteria bacterium]MBI3387924.1 TetR/AcrR family transcriptional regulator [Deltaproteobacteria bacterium]
MARKRPEDRVDRLVECAARVFTERGYKRTQMADVARAMGVAPGTLYLYVESKEALFDLVVQRAFLDQPAAPLPQLPIGMPAPGQTLRHVRERFAREARLPALQAAYARTRADEPRIELERVIRELYAVVARNRRGNQLLERSALDHPALAQLYFKRMRRTLIERLTQYLERRIRHGAFRPVPDTATAARLILEIVAWFAMHRHGDRDPVILDERLAEDTVVAVLVNAFVKEEKQYAIGHGSRRADRRS